MCAEKWWEKTKRAGDSRAAVFSTKLPSNTMAFASAPQLFQEERRRDEEQRGSRTGAGMGRRQTERGGRERVTQDNSITSFTNLV